MFAIIFFRLNPVERTLTEIMIFRRFGSRMIKCIALWHFHQCLLFSSVCCFICFLHGAQQIYQNWNNMQLHLFHLKETDCRSVFLYLMLFSPMSLSLFVLSSALNNNKNTTHLLHTINTHKAIIAFSHLKVCSIHSIVNKITTQWLTREEKKKKVWG